MNDLIARAVDSGILPDLEYREMLEREMGQAGISKNEPAADAARMLAEFRDNQGRQNFTQE